jgi:cell wall-associated NlpC family hydrolase
MTHRDAAREWMIRTALAYLGTPYRWSGDDPSGFDCSGLVVECLRSVGLIELPDSSADQLYTCWKLHEVANPDIGCLVFWLNSAGQAFHVGICLDPWHQVSAGEGDRGTVTETDAWNRNAYVRIRPIPVSNSKCRFCDPLKALKE